MSIIIIIKSAIKNSTKKYIIITTVFYSRMHNSKGSVMVAS